MRSCRGRARGLLALLMVLPLALSACSDSATKENGGPIPAELAGGSIAGTIDLRGAQFAVGSKEFTEQLVLGQITILALQAAGATVVDQTGLSGTNIVRTALLNGDVDMYWDYAGTGWELFLGHDDTIPDPMRQFQATAEEDLAANGVRWLGPAAFGDQYAIARRSDVTGPLAAVQTLSDLTQFVAQNPDEATLCAAAEFLDRLFFEFQDTYDVRFPPANVYQNAFALNFVNVARGSPCNFAEVFTTDARIATLDLTVLRDDKNVFLTQLAALTTRDEAYQRYPQLGDMARMLGERLTEDTVIELNRLVDVEGKEPVAVAAQFLQTNGFIG